MNKNFFTATTFLLLVGCGGTHSQTSRSDTRSNSVDNRNNLSSSETVIGTWTNNQGCRTASENQKVRYEVRFYSYGSSSANEHEKFLMIGDVKYEKDCFGGRSDPLGLAHYYYQIQDEVISTRPIYGAGSKALSLRIVNENEIVLNGEILTRVSKDFHHP